MKWQTKVKNGKLKCHKHAKNLKKNQQNKTKQKNKLMKKDIVVKTNEERVEKKRINGKKF